MKKRLLAIGIIIISLFTMVFTIYDRAKVESNNKGVEIILDYYDIEKLAKQSDEDLGWWFKKLKSMGANSVAIEEESFASLEKENEEIEIKMVGNIINQLDWKENYPKEFIDKVDNEEIDKFDLVAITKSQRLLDFIKDGLTERYSTDFYSIIEGERSFIIVDGKAEEALFTTAQSIKDVNGKIVRAEDRLVTSEVDSIGLGFDKEKVELIKSSGLKVVPRPKNFSRYPDKLVDAYINETKKFNIKPSTMIFSGKEVLGHGGSQGELVEYLKDSDLKVGIVEDVVQRQHIKQEGMGELIPKIDYNSVRVFSVWDWVQIRYKYYNYEGAEEIENAMYRAITERNIRAVYFRGFKYDEYKYVTDIEEYQRTFDSLKDRLAEHNISIGTSTVMANNDIGPLRLGLLGMGLVIFGMILLRGLIKLDDRIEIAIAIFSIVCIFGAVYFAPSLADKVLALGSAIIFPGLSSLYVIRKSRKIIINKNKKRDMKKVILDSMVTLVISVFIALVGGLYIGSILSDIKYLLEIDIYRGVKISQLLPMIIFVLLYFSEFGYNRPSQKLDRPGIKKKEIVTFLDTNIKIKYVIGGLVLLVVGYIYIARTGHETEIQPTNLEMIFRNFLENELLARPRNKEFLIAFPSIIACIYMAYKKYDKFILPFAFAGSIGFTSVLNTFSHLRSPLYLSSVRTIYGIILGGILGIIAIIALEILIRIINNVRGAKVNE